MDTTRRSFLKGLLSGVAATTAAVVVPKIFVPEPEPIRRYWFLGGFKTGGLRPIEGAPGMFVDENGNLVCIRDFTESDKYDTIVIPEEAGFTGVPDPHMQRAMEMFKVPYEDVTQLMREHAKRANFGDSAGLSYPLIKNGGDCPPSDITFNVKTWTL